MAQYHGHATVRHALWKAVALAAVATLVGVGSAPAVTNGEIAFSSNAAGTTICQQKPPQQRPPFFELYAMDESGGSVARLTQLLATSFRPNWSPDGTKIAFQSNYDQGCEISKTDIYSMNVDGTGLMRLTSAAAVNAQPVWSPDGTKIAFHTDRDGAPAADYEIYVMNADGTGERRLTYSSTPPTAFDAYATWSPDGTRIAFASNRQGGNNDIYVIDAEGKTPPVNITRSPEEDQLPAWSPGGTKIAYTSYQGTAGDGEIVLMDADGTNPVNLTANTGNDYHPAWSPDGTKIAFTSNRLGVEKIFVMNADGSDQHWVGAVNTATETTPSWRPIPAGAGMQPTPGGGTTSAGSQPRSTAKLIRFRLTKPRWWTARTNRVSRRALYGYVRHGFKGRAQGVAAVRAQLVRVGRFCHRLDRLRMPCNRTSKRGVRLRGRSFTYKPLAGSQRGADRLKHGRRIATGRYRLVLRLSRSGGGGPVFVRYRIEVVR